MIGFEFDDTVILEQKKVLETALSTNPKTQAVLRKLIRIVIMEARSGVFKATENALEHDPRHAARAIRTAVYKKILGANINIYNSRKAHGSTTYEPPRTLRAGQRGGNRVKRSLETDRRMHYDALDRGFILRFVNSGTQARETRLGNRGSISPRNFFKGAAERQLVHAADNLANLIDTEIMAMLNKNKK